MTIAKVDATANDVPDEIAGFPTIKLFPAGSKSSPVDYSGSRTVEDLVAFIRDNGSHKVDGYADADADVDMEDVASAAGTILPSLTEEMQHQAPAATKAAAAVVAGAAGAVKDAVGAILEVVAGDDDGIDEHDEL